MAHLLTAPVRLAEDRSIAVPPGHIVRTAYVPTENIRLACRDTIHPAAVERAWNTQLQLGSHQRWPCPVGEWRGTEFWIQDGRHTALSAQMHGMTHILVAWLEPR